MANEISVITGLTATKGALRFSFPQSTLQVSMSGSHFVENVQDFTTTTSGLNMGGSSFTPGYASFVNTDPTGSGSYVEIGTVVSGTFSPMMKIWPSGKAIIPLGTLSLSGRSGSGTQTLNFGILEL